MILGTVAAVDANNGITVIVDGEEVASEKKYSYLSSYVPAANDKVIIEEISGSYVILGKICTTVAESGQALHAETATTATNAGHATTADHADTARVSESCSGNATTATTATRATKATTAETCTGNAATADRAEVAGRAAFADLAEVATRAYNADNATTADRAEVAGRAEQVDHASSADVAMRCSGNAATATKAYGLDSTNYSTYLGQLVTGVTKKTDYNLGITYVSDVNLSISKFFVHKS